MGKLQNNHNHQIKEFDYLKLQSTFFHINRHLQLLIYLISSLFTKIDNMRSRMACSSKQVEEPVCPRKLSNANLNPAEEE